MIRHTLRSLSLLLLPLAACGNNIGVLWDPVRGGSGSQPTDGSNIFAPAADGRLVDGRPRVEDAFPKGNGWSTTVPIVVVFNESIARNSVEPAATGGGGNVPPAPGSTARVYLRAEGTTQALPSSISYLLGDRVVALTPTAALSATTTYEVVVDPAVRDLDAVQKGGSAPAVVATFTPDGADTVVDGRIVATLPKDNGSGVEREAPFLAFFDRLADAATITDTSFGFTAGGAVVQGQRDFPVTIANVPDTRIVRFRPTGAWPASSTPEFRVDDTITFNSAAGKLDFRGRTPFSRFTVVAGARPARVAIGNAPTGFDNVVNATNLANTTVAVDVDASVPAGSTVIVRVYGLEPRTRDTTDLGYVERTASVPSNGPTTVTVSFAGELGTADRLRFEEGSLTIVAAVEVARARSSFAVSAKDAVLLDVTPPTVESLLPALPGSSTDVVAEFESFVMMGKAGEQIAAAELNAAGVTTSLFGANADGTFAMRPIYLGHRTGGVPYTLTVTDRAGNMAPLPIQGQIRPRGVVTGVQNGVLTVLVHDDATFAPLAGATVVVESALPQKPAVDRVTGQTDAGGRVVFRNLTTPRVTVTAIAAGHDIATVLDVPSSFVALTLKPNDDAVAVANLKGTIGFLPTAGQTALVGVNAFEDPLLLDVATSTTAPTALRTMTVRAGRPLVVQALTGAFPPLAQPTFAGFACRLCGVDGKTPSAPDGPLAGGSELDLTIAILPSTGSAIPLAAAYDVDFATAAGLGALDGEPVVRVHGTLAGFGRSALFGVGFSTVRAGSAYSINAGYALPVALALQPFQPTLWVTTDAKDAAGNLTRHRRLVSDFNLGITFPTGAPLGIPTVQAPAGASNGAPEVVVEDRLDPASIPGGVGFLTIRAIDANGRAWEMTVLDRDAASGQDHIQFPDLRGLGVSGLANGAWTIVATTELVFSPSDPNAAGKQVSRDGEFSLEERHRQLVKLARSAPIAFTVQ